MYQNHDVCGLCGDGFIMKSVRVTDETHVELTRILGEFIARDGKSRTFDDVIKELTLFWKEPIRRYF